MSRVLCIVQARLGSTRLPRKALVDIGGVTLIRRVVDRVALLGEPMVVATPSVIDSLDIARGLKRSCQFWADGSIPESDVLRRFARCVDAMKLRTDVILRVTADSPLWDPAQGRAVLDLLKSTGADYASNIAPGYRDGEDAEAFTVEALMRADREATSAHDREHVTPWMRLHLRCVTLPATEDRSAVKTSVDTEADLERVRRMVDALAR